MPQLQPTYLILLLLLSLSGLVLSTPVKTTPSVQNVSGQRTILGFNGFNGIQRPPQASAGGELGAVFYIADAVDLARLFANGADPSRNYICTITADSAAWSLVPKVWVPQRILNLGGNAMNSQFPGSVLFANHAHPGFPNAPAAVHQMGVRQAQIDRLQLQAECRHLSQWANIHTTLNYPSLIGTWNIQTPALLSFNGIEEWMRETGHRMAEKLGWYH